MRCAAYWQDPPASLVILSLSHSFSQTFPLWAQIMTQWQQCTVDQKVPTVILHQAWAPKPGTCPPGSPWCRRWRPGAPRRGWFQAVEAPVDFMTTLAETRALVAWRYISSHIFWAIGEKHHFPATNYWPILRFCGICVWTVLLLLWQYNTNKIYSIPKKDFNSTINIKPVLSTKTI